MIEHAETLLETSDDSDLHTCLVAAVNVHPHQYSNLALKVDKMVYPNVDGLIAISAISTEEQCSVGERGSDTPLDVLYDMVRRNSKTNFQ
jgi:hypothetical protein